MPGVGSAGSGECSIVDSQDSNFMFCQRAGVTNAWNLGTVANDTLLSAVVSCFTSGTDYYLYIHYSNFDVMTRLRGGMPTYASYVDFSRPPI